MAQDAREKCFSKNKRQLPFDKRIAASDSNEGGLFSLIGSARNQLDRQHGITSEHFKAFAPHL